MATIDFKKAIVTLRDGDTPFNHIDITIGEGNFTFTEARNIEYILNRGSLTGGTVREGDEVPVELSFDAVWEYVTGPGGSTPVPTIHDALHQTGDASTWVSSDSDTCQPYALDVVVTYDPVPSSCGDYEEITFADFRFTQINGDLGAGSFAISGSCNITKASSTRDTNS